jgi:hypothetical protein
MRMTTSLTQHRYPRGRGHPRHLGQSRTVPARRLPRARPGSGCCWHSRTGHSSNAAAVRKPQATPTASQVGPAARRAATATGPASASEFSIVVASTLTALSSAGERTSHGMMAIGSGRYVPASIELAAARAMTTTTGPWTAAAPPSSSARIPVATAQQQLPAHLVNGLG